MKILVVDRDKEYLLLLGYIFQSDTCDASITYVSDPSELETATLDQYDVCLSAYRMGRYGNAVDVYKCLKRHGFKGRFIIVSMDSKRKIFKEMIASGADTVEVVEKGKSRLIRDLLRELQSAEKAVA